MVEIEGRMWLTNGAMIDDEPGDGPGDQGTYTFLQEVLSLPNRTVVKPGQNSARLESVNQPIP